MKHRILPALLVLLAVLFACAACAGAETVKISGVEQADLRSAPNGKTVAVIFQDTPAEQLETKGKWSRIRIGEDPVTVTGWMLTGCLVPVEEGETPYCGQDCIPAQGHDSVALLDAPKRGARILNVWDGSHEETYLTVAGVFSGNEWLLTALSGEDGVEWYCAAADSLASFEGAYVISRAADTVVSLRAEPNTKAKVLASCFGGVYANYLFDGERKEGWTRICVGGTAGFMMNDFLMEAEFDVPPYRPPLAVLSKEAVPVYAQSTGNDPLIGMDALLSRRDRFTVLARGKTRYLVSIFTDEAGRYLYGWIDHTALADENLIAGSTSAVLTRDTPVYNWSLEEIGSLQAGAQVTLRWFYADFSADSGSPVLDYCDPASSRWVWIDANEYDFYLDEWGNGFVPVDAVQLDPRLVLPSP